jgi:hypothetical protein
MCLCGVFPVLMQLSATQWSREHCWATPVNVVTTTWRRDYSQLLKHCAGLYPVHLGQCSTNMLCVYTYTYLCICNSWHFIISMLYSVVMLKVLVVTDRTASDSERYLCLIRRSRLEIYRKQISIVDTFHIHWNPYLVHYNGVADGLFFESVEIV